jgi:hypothetical protein
VSDSEELIYRFFVENGAVSHTEVGDWCCNCREKFGHGFTSDNFQNGQLNHISNMPYAEHVNMINFLAITGANFNIPNEVYVLATQP